MFKHIKQHHTKWIGKYCPALPEYNIWLTYIDWQECQTYQRMMKIGMTTAEVCSPRTNSPKRCKLSELEFSQRSISSSIAFIMNSLPLSNVHTHIRVSTCILMEIMWDSFLLPQMDYLIWFLSSPPTVIYSSLSVLIQVHLPKWSTHSWRT